MASSRKTPGKLQKLQENSTWTSGGLQMDSTWSLIGNVAECKVLSKEPDMKSGIVGLSEIR